MKYTNVEFLQSNPLPIENTCAFAFSTIQNILGRHFLGIFLSSIVVAILMELMSENWVSFRTDLILGKRKKLHGARSGQYGGVLKLQCFFLRKTDKYSGLCEQERNCDGAPMRGLPKDSASCHSLILRGAKESFYRQFGSLFGLGVGIQ